MDTEYPWSARQSISATTFNIISLSVRLSVQEEDKKDKPGDLSTILDIKENAVFKSNTHPRSSTPMILIGTSNRPSLTADKRSHDQTKACIRQSHNVTSSSGLLGKGK